MVVVDVRQPLSTSASRNEDGLPGTVAACFRTYVRPETFPRLTLFCKELTGITQECVDAAPTLGQALPVADAWLRAALLRLNAAAPHSVRARADDRGLPVPDLYDDVTKAPAEPAVAATAAAGAAAGAAAADESAPCEAPPPSSAASDLASRRAAAAALPPFAFVTDGPWDIKSFLHAECARKGLLETAWPSHPPYWDAWVNLRQLHADTLSAGRRLNVRSMLASLRLRFVGEEHCGLHDAVNIARIARAMLARGVRLSVNEGLSPVIAERWSRRRLAAAAARERGSPGALDAASFRASPGAFSGSGEGSGSWADAVAAGDADAEADSSPGPGIQRKLWVERRRQQQRLSRLEQQRGGRNRSHHHGHQSGGASGGSSSGGSRVAAAEAAATGLALSPSGPNDGGGSPGPAEAALPPAQAGAKCRPACGSATSSSSSGAVGAGPQAGPGDARKRRGHRGGRRRSKRSGSGADGAGRPAGAGPHGSGRSGQRPESAAVAARSAARGGAAPATGTRSPNRPRPKAPPHTP